MSAMVSVNDNSIDDLLPVAEALIPLCALKRQYLQSLLEHAAVEFLCAGDQVFARGVCDFRHVYLLSGRMRLGFASGYSEVVEARASRYPLANEMPRPCEGIALTDCTVLILDSDKLDRILSWSQVAQYLLAQLCVDRDLDEDIAWMTTVVESNLFLKVPPVNAASILNTMETEMVRAGEVILREGEIGDCCYFIKDGAARVTAHQPLTGELTHLADVGVGRCFGEDALVYETVRNATVTMLTDGVLMRLDKASFQLLLNEPEVDEVTEDEIQRLAQQSVFIDVRTQEEYDQGHLCLAANVPLSILALKQRLLHRDTPYVLYCDTGRRSRAAAYLLAKQGYNTFALQGGLVGAGMQYQLIDDCSYMLKDGRVERR